MYIATTSSEVSEYSRHNYNCNEKKCLLLCVLMAVTTLYGDIHGMATDTVWRISKR